MHWRQYIQVVVATFTTDLALRKAGVGYFRQKQIGECKGETWRCAPHEWSVGDWAWDTAFDSPELVFVVASFKASAVRPSKICNMSRFVELLAVSCEIALNGWGGSFMWTYMQDKYGIVGSKGDFDVAFIYFRSSWARACLIHLGHGGLKVCWRWRKYWLLDE